MIRTKLGSIRAMLNRGDRNVTRLRRKRAMANFCWRSWPTLRLILLVAGYVWMLSIPSSLHGQSTYIDENALQPGQVHTYWSWADVYRADQYLGHLEALRDRNASSHEFSGFISTEFRKLGIPSSTQNYKFHTASEVLNGTNAYAVLSAPRASGSEAMVISASRLSRTGDGNGTLNLRGIATVLALAGYLKGYSLWAKDLVFVVSDGYLDGMQAWITAYHGVTQPNLVADPLSLSSGAIWTALNIDYPGHSFSHLGVFFEGLNGRLPNQDLINSFNLISRYTGGVPVTVYDHYDLGEFPERDEQLIPAWVPPPIRSMASAKEYAYRAKNIVRHWNYQARGQASGVHGLLHQFRIDAITLFAVPAHGPHGFHAVGRVIESTLRTTNNLLERLHASFFFYLLVGTHTFMKIGTYLPSAVLVSTAMLFSGLGEWVSARWIQIQEVPAEKYDRKEGTAPDAGSVHKTWITRSRPVLPALLIMVLTHLMGVLLSYLMTRSWIVSSKNVSYTLIFCVYSAIPYALTLSLAKFSTADTAAPVHKILKSLNLCLASTVISITSVLNFSLAASLAILLALPTILSGPSRLSAIKYGCYSTLGLGWLFLHQEIRQACYNWEVLGVWFGPFVCIVYMPLVLQAGIASILPS